MDNNYENETALSVDEEYENESDSDIAFFAEEIFGEENKEINSSPSKKRPLDEDSFTETEKKCLHKMFGCYQCRNQYNGDIDLKYHEKLNIIFSQMKYTISLINQTVT